MTVRIFCYTVSLIYYGTNFKILRFLGLYEMSKNIIKNMQYMVDKYVFVPTGGRIYYLKRSQPPFFSNSLQVLEVTHDLKFLRESLPYFEKVLLVFKNKPLIDKKIFL